MKAHPDQRRGRTRITRRHAIAAIAGFWFLLLAVPVGQLVYDRYVPEARPWRDWSPVPAFDGKRYEERLEDCSWWRRYLLPPVQSLLVRYGRDGNETVAVGYDGRLYDEAGIRYFAGTGLPRKSSTGGDPEAAIRDFAAQLRARDIELVLAVVPPKSALEAEALGGAETAGAVFQPGWIALQGRLEQSGVRVIDLTAALAALRRQGVEPFLAADSHWRPEAVPVAARAIAAALGVTAREVRSAIEPVTQTGDLAPLLKLNDAAGLFPPETVPVARVIDVPQGRSRILLVGDSFTNIYSYDGMGWGTGGGLAEHLAATLGEPVTWIARNGNGAYASREALMRHPELLEGKTILIWEFAMRQLADGDWKLLPLPEPRGLDGPARDRIRITGTILDVSEAPRSGRAIYPNLLRAVRIRVGDGEKFVYVEAMRDRRLADAAYWRIGDTVSLQLTPWEERESDYAAWSRGELSDPAVLALPQWFGEIVTESPAPRR